MLAMAMIAVAAPHATFAAEAAGVVSPTVSVQRLDQVRAAASQAQSQCHGQIHHDTYAFERCVLGLIEAERKPSARRLGIEYFGYVGAMNSARMGMLGAENTAHEFLTRFRRTQKRLRISDLSLCQTVPGDCDVRIARIRMMESSPAARKRPSRDASEELQREH